MPEIDAQLRRLQLGPPAWQGAERVFRRLDERSVPDHFYDLLAQRGVAIPAALRDKPPREPNGPHPAIQEGLLRLYREQPAMVLLFESMMDVDEGLQEWRYRHVKMVERTIGHKPGTGGSSGAAYLRETVFRSFFPDLWEIRDVL